MCPCTAYIAQPLRSTMERDYGSEIRVGHAAEMLVEAELLLKGVVPIRVLHKYPYDLLVPIGISEFVRVQVKAVSEPRAEGPMPGAYQFSLRKGKGRVPYLTTDLDLFCLVALDIRKIAYRTTASLTKAQGVITTINLKVKDFDEYADWPYPILEVE